MLTSPHPETAHGGTASAPAAPRDFDAALTQLMGAVHCAALTQGSVEVPLDAIRAPLRPRLLERLGSGPARYALRLGGGIDVAATALAGLWRIEARQNDRHVVLALEVALVPERVRAAARQHADEALPSSDDESAAAVLAALAKARARFSAEHAPVSLALEPFHLSPASRAALRRALGVGAVLAQHAGPPALRAQLTRVAWVWWCEYLSPETGRSLDALEVGEAPALVAAAPAALASTEAALLDWLEE